jgi:DNA polymerase-3 subunit alpha
MPLPVINAAIVNELESLTAKNKGKVILKFNIWDPETKMTLNLFSRNVRIEINDEILSFFDKYDDLAFKIN